MSAADGPALAKLRSLLEPVPLSPAPGVPVTPPDPRLGPLQDSACGLVGFEQAPVVLARALDPRVLALGDWNGASAASSRAAYPALADADVVVFAVDLFGAMFALRARGARGLDQVAPRAGQVGLKRQ